MPTDEEKRSSGLMVQTLRVGVTVNECRRSFMHVNDQIVLIALNLTLTGVENSVLMYKHFLTKGANFGTQLNPVDYHSFATDSTTYGKILKFLADYNLSEYEDLMLRVIGFGANAKLDEKKDDVAQNDRLKQAHSLYKSYQSFKESGIGKINEILSYSNEMSNVPTPDEDRLVHWLKEVKFSFSNGSEKDISVSFTGMYEIELMRYMVDLLSSKVADYESIEAFLDKEVIFQHPWQDSGSFNRKAINPARYTFCRGFVDMVMEIGAVRNKDTAFEVFYDLYKLCGYIDPSDTAYPEPRKIMRLWYNKRT